MARIQVFQSAADTNERIELFWDDAVTPASQSRWEIDIVNAADAVLETILMTNTQVDAFKSLWKNAVNGAICLTGGPATEDPTHWVGFTRDNLMTWVVIPGTFVTQEYVNFTVQQTAQFMSWLNCGHELAAA